MKYGVAVASPHAATRSTVFVSMEGLGLSIELAMTIRI